MQSENYSEWKVGAKKIDGHKLYEVYRLRNKYRNDHEGNRIYLNGGTFVSSADAERCAVKMNREELNGTKQ